MPSKHVEPERGPRRSKLQRPELSVNTHTHTGSLADTNTGPLVISTLKAPFFPAVQQAEHPSAEEYLFHH